MSGANYAHCDHEPCLRPTGSTKVFYDADTDIPEGTVIMHPSCHRDFIAAAEARGYDKAVAKLRELDRYRAWLDAAERSSDEPLVKRHADYLEAIREDR